MARKSYFEVKVKANIKRVSVLHDSVKRWLLVVAIPQPRLASGLHDTTSSC